MTLCMCGCGEKAPIATHTQRRDGRLLSVKGEPYRYVRGHNRRKSPVEHIEDPDTGCWIWQRGTASVNHYPVLGTPRHGERYAHRANYVEMHGPIPEGTQLHHTCKAERCVNPDHLVPLTPKQHQHEHSNLNEADVRKMRASDLSHIDLAAKFGATMRQVRAIRGNETWVGV